jgi:hypothetical protein
LKYLNLPELTSCNGGAFSKCTSLKLFKAPKFKTVGDKAFYGDAALESVTTGMTAPGTHF